MGEYVNEHIKPDVIFWTGDTVPHNMFEEKHFTDKLEYIDRVTSFFRANFTNMTVYPLLGNHDFAVSNLQDFREPDKIFAYV